MTSICTASPIAEARTLPREGNTPYVEFRCEFDHVNSHEFRRALALSCGDWGRTLAGGTHIVGDGIDWTTTRSRLRLQRMARKYDLDTLLSLQVAMSMPPSDWTSYKLTARCRCLRFRVQRLSGLFEPFM